MQARFVSIAVLAGALTVPATTGAQVVGTFRWQLLPFCNVVTLTATQTGAIYTLDGTDDQCGGASTPAGVTGVAYPASGGSIGLSLSTVLAPDARAVHTDVSLVAGTANGTWRDSAGNTGTLVLTPGGAVPGTLRPVSPGGLPPGSVTALQLAAAAVTNATLATGAVTTSKIAANAISSSALIASGTIELSDLNQQLSVSSASSWTIPAGGCVAKDSTVFVSPVQEGDLLLTRIQSGPPGVFALPAVAGANGRYGIVVCNPTLAAITSQNIAVSFKRVPR